MLSPPFDPSHRPPLLRAAMVQARLPCRPSGSPEDANFPSRHRNNPAPWLPIHRLPSSSSSSERKSFAANRLLASVLNLPSRHLTRPPPFVAIHKLPSRSRVTSRTTEPRCPGSATASKWYWLPRYSAPVSVPI